MKPLMKDLVLTNHNQKFPWQALEVCIDEFSALTYFHLNGFPYEKQKCGPSTFIHCQ